MVKKLLLLFGLFCVFFTAQAQLPPACDPGPPPEAPAEDCESACIYCNINAITSNSGNYSAGSVPSFCSNIQNDQWLGFIASSASATFTITPSNCTNGDGLQVALYGGCGEAFIACNGGNSGGGSTPVSITATLIPGTNYFLLIDGYSADACDVLITVAPPQVPPNVGPISAIQGPAVVCPGATVVYSVPNVTGAGAYTWTGPAGTTFNGEPSGATFDAPGGRIVTVTMGNTSGQICVSVANSCNTGGTVCKNITVQPIPVTNLPAVIVCYDDVPYTTPWGDDVYVSSTVETTIPSYQGCDSTIRQKVTIKPPIMTNIGNKYVCEGGSVTVCGTVYNVTGFIEEHCNSYQNCDSLVTGNLFVLDPLAEILGGGTLSCSTNSIVLTSSPSSGNKIWRNLATGGVVATGNNYTVTAAGTFTLTSSITLGGVTCTSADTITITGNTTPPTAAATATGFIGCTTTTVQLNVTTNASPATYMWAGPSGFNSTIQNPLATASGTYIVTVTSTATGCTATSTANVTGNTTPPTASATGATISCNTPSVVINASTNAGTPTFLWSGPNGYSSTAQNPTVTQSGPYSVVVTNTANGCTATANTTVALDNAPPGATATVSGVIGCPTPNVTINTTTAGTTPTYSWGNGPTTPSISVGAAGTYIVTITGANGCTSSASATVTGDTIAPNASAAGGTLSCAVQTIPVVGNSSTNGVTYAWTGPSFTSSSQSPNVTAVGPYILTVTAANGCTTTATAVVDGDFAVPTAAATGGIISCSSSSTTISGSSTTNGATFGWTGPSGFTSTNAVETVNNLGTYTLTVTGPNGCTTTATAQVDPDANVPNSSVNGGTLTCAVTSILLDANSTTSGVTFTWTLPNGSTVVQEDLTATLDGQYTLVVSNPANGCSALSNVTVAIDSISPNVSATGGILTCASPNFTLQGSSSTPNVTWAWTGPNGFTSTSQNPVTTFDGNYNLVVQNPLNGCTASAATVVQADQNAPQASTSTGTLTCATTSITLNGNATLPSTYSWTGPNSFVSTSQTPAVTEPGDYILTVTAANGCTDVATATVAQDIAAPSLAATGSTIDCNNPQTTITVSSDPGAVFAWDGPNNYTSTTATTTVTTPGGYGVTVTGTNGCKSLGTVVVNDDTEAPAASATSPSTLTCALLNAQILATITNGTSAIQTIDWTGPLGFISNVEDPSVTNPGVYTVTATSINGCTSTAQVTVLQDIVPPNATASGATLTCATTTIQLDGGSSTTGSTFSWAGPAGFSSTLEDPMVTVNGPYDLVVTGPNGCTNTAQAIAAQDIVAPGANALSSNNLDCDELQSTLTGSSPTGLVTYAWAGPSFTSTQQNPQVNAPGTYTVTTTGPNGCTSTADVTITQDITAPNVTAAGDTLDCISGQGTLTGGSSSTITAWNWAGPNGFTSALQNPGTTDAGLYTLTVTGSNGCTSTTTTSVELNNSSPQVTLAGGGTLTCAITSISITGTITTPGATGTWSNGAATANISVSTPGQYTYTVVAPNGCISAPSVTVPQDIQIPQAVVATGGQLDCNFPTISITGGSSTPGVTYVWNGPGGYTSNQQNPNNIVTPGAYTLVVTNPVNGCTNSASATVSQNPTVPDIAVSTGTLTCSVPQVTLNATTATPSVTFQWSGPGGFTSTQEDPAVSVPGQYTVIAKATSGCTSTFQITVPQDIAQPGATATGVTLNCFAPTGQITATSTTGNVSYAWSGPLNFTSTVANPNVSNAGLYTVTITGQNGCTSVATANVLPDSNAPVISSSGGTVTCAVTSISLGASSNIPVTWQWNGPGGFTSTAQNPTASTPGNYTVVATATNGCSTTSTTTVTPDTNPPSVSIAAPNELNCTTLSVTMAASVQGTGTFTYAWGTGVGNIVSGGTSANPVVDAAGAYSLTVTNTVNGCTTVQNATVPINNNTPSAAVLQKRDVKCHGETNGSVQIQSVTGGTAPLTYTLLPNQVSSSPNFSNLAPNNYTILIEDANGCELETSFTITEPTELIVNLGEDTTIHLGNSIQLSLDDIVNDPGRVETRIVKPADLVVGDLLFPTYSFRYTVTVVDSNGCVASDERIVVVNKERYVYIPNIFYPESGNTENNIFRIYGGEDVEKVVSFRVFDRWGESVHEYFDFTPDSPAHGWDGTIRGKKMPPSVYVFFAEILFKDGEIEIFKGDVTLYR